MDFQISYNRPNSSRKSIRAPPHQPLLRKWSLYIVFRRTFLPKVMRPTYESGGIKFIACKTDSLTCCSSSSIKHVSMTNRNTGGPPRAYRYWQKKKSSKQNGSPSRTTERSTEKWYAFLLQYVRATNLWGWSVHDVLILYVHTSRWFSWQMETTNILLYVFHFYLSLRFSALNTELTEDITGLRGVSIQCESALFHPRFLHTRFAWYN